MDPDRFEHLLDGSETVISDAWICSYGNNGVYIVAPGGTEPRPIPGPARLKQEYWVLVLLAEPKRQGPSMWCTALESSSRSFFFAVGFLVVPIEHRPSPIRHSTRPRAQSSRVTRHETRLSKIGIVMIVDDSNVGYSVFILQ